MEGYCSTGQSPQWAVVPMEEGEEEDIVIYFCSYLDVELLMHSNAGVRVSIFK
jgi:hypothetical protein